MASSGVKDVIAAVNVGTEPDVVVVHPPECAHAEGLEAAAVGENGPGPPHELMQPPQSVHRLHAGPQVQVVGVAQDDLRSHIHNFVGGKSLDGGLGGHRHKYGRVHRTVGRGKSAGPGAAVAVVDLEREGWGGHGDSLAGWRRRTASRIINTVYYDAHAPGHSQQHPVVNLPKESQPFHRLAHLSHADGQGAAEHGDAVENTNAARVHEAGGGGPDLGTHRCRRQDYESHQRVHVVAQGI